jgi:hypothetical protein
MVQDERKSRDFSVKASNISLLKSIETARKMAEIYLKICFEFRQKRAISSFSYCCLMYKQSIFSIKRRWNDI